MHEQLIDWVYERLDHEGWSIRELARRAGVNHSTISMVLNRTRNPGPDLCRGLARAFNVPPDVVFRLAGLLPERPSAPDPGLREISHLYGQLTDADQEEVLALMRVLMKEKLSRYETPPRPQAQTAEP